jgi:pyridoxal phosphate enzyme (YggS family)
MSIAENVEQIRERIARACEKSGRPAESVALVAVSKTFDAQAIREAASCGLTEFGENFVQEFRDKRVELDSLKLNWHFIGHLQRNKVKDVVGSVAIIEAVDSLRLAEEISKRSCALGCITDVFLEVNTTGEQTKFGAKPDEVIELAGKFSALEGIRLQGLMTIGLFGPTPDASRPAFTLLRKLKDDLASNGVSPPHLSMGMSGDFEAGIAEGSTIVRVGTAIFGKRMYAN